LLQQTISGFDLRNILDLPVSSLSNGPSNVRFKHSLNGSSRSNSSGLLSTAFAIRARRVSLNPMEGDEQGTLHDENLLQQTISGFDLRNILDLG
jgi:hypothetical protein